MTTYPRRDLPPGGLWEVVDFELLLVAFERVLIGVLVLLHQGRVTQLLVDLLCHLLCDRLGLVGIWNMGAMLTSTSISICSKIVKIGSKVVIVCKVSLYLMLQEVSIFTGKS